jgi:hypothetical protein
VLYYNCSKGGDKNGGQRQLALFQKNKRNLKSLLTSLTAYDIIEARKEDNTSSSTTKKN